MTRKRFPATEVWQLSLLKSHPLQDQYFRDLTPGEFTGLADDIKRNGLKFPMEILPDGTIIQGHQRTKVLKHIGHKEYEVLVRYDLADAKPEVIEREFLSDNLNRRHLGPLARARVAARLYELAMLRKHAQLPEDSDDGRARDRFGKVLGLSGRSADRYRKLLKAPLAVQNAVDSGELAMGLALRVADLDGPQQKALVAAIKGGVAVREAVSKVFGRARRPAAKGRTSAPNAVRAVLKVCRQHEAELRSASTAEVASCVGDLKEIGEIFRSVWSKRPQD